MNIQQNTEEPFDINSMPWIECNCGNKTFDSGIMVKKISMILSPTGKEEIVPVDIIVCKSCGKIPSFYASRIPGIPEELISE